MWGEILEEENYDPNEDFYDHDKAMHELKRRTFMEEKKKGKLKRKVIYVYEDDEDNQDVQEDK